MADRQVAKEEPHLNKSVSVLCCTADSGLVMRLVWVAGSVLNCAAKLLVILSTETH